MEEKIVLVDKTGQPIGIADKLPSHHADTPLHLAFSCYVFDDQGRFLVTQRAHVKKVWPGVWTNSVCGHPAPGESMIDAMDRRLQYELGMTAQDFQLILPEYTYKTPPYRGIVEHEFCPVYVARATSQPKPNPDEVEAYRWQSWEGYCQAVEADPENIFSWWTKDQLQQIKGHPLIKQYSKGQASE